MRRLLEHVTHMDLATLLAERYAKYRAIGQFHEAQMEVMGMSSGNGVVSREM